MIYICQKCVSLHKISIKNVCVYTFSILQLKLYGMFNRTIMKDLAEWKSRKDRKPLFLLGARQVGKTFVLQHFGKAYFEHCAYFSLDEEEGVCQLFRTHKRPLQLIEQLSYLTDVPILPQKTLLIFDEIQSCPEAISAMKYFCEQAPEYVVACAGSLLGLSFGHEGFSFPVGKVDHLSIYPVSFSEFLEQKDASLYRYYLSIEQIAPLPQVFFDRFLQAFNAYRLSGGMPEAAMKMIEQDVLGVERTLQGILKDYSFDIVKHASPVLANRITHIWNSLPSQLAKENKKFVYQLVRPGARAREYEDALWWMQNAGLVHKVSLCSTPLLPLKAHEELSIFKIYALDIGLLRALAGLGTDIYLNESPAFKDFKGALAENYVYQSLLAAGFSCAHYWASGNQAEVDFILQAGSDIIPIEVKSGQSVAGRSLTEYNKKFTPKRRIRFSLLNLSESDGLINIPLFLSDRLNLLLQQSISVTAD